MSKSAGIILNGAALTVVPQDDYIICADGGMKFAQNLKVDLVLGDFDSSDYNDAPNGSKTLRYKIEKDATDGELAILHALTCGYRKINIYAALGGRVDHILGNLALLSIAHGMNATATIIDSEQTIFLTTSKSCVHLPCGSFLSLIPFGGNAIVSDGINLKYPLDNLHLTPHSTLGISNVATSNYIEFSVVSGKVIVVVNAPNTTITITSSK
ncbi:MAG: thiamine diphosphokinase [Christensenellaceae bacterium]|jgi:thiamine pyrophosphokinase|nr:thiamine diphosphokinase [Christensenellaceae bacterium]